MSGPTRSCIAIRADAGPAEGWGHVSRCLALVEALSKHLDWPVRLYCRTVDEALLRRMKKAGVTPVTDPSFGVKDASDAALQAALRKDGARLVIKDHYGLGPVWMNSVARDAVFTVALEDDPSSVEAVLPVADMIWSSAPRLASKSNLLSGPENALVGSGFRSTGVRPIGERPRAAIVGAGGSDLGRDFYATVLSDMVPYLTDWSFHFLVPHHQSMDLDRAADLQNVHVHINPAPDAIADLMRQSRVFVGAGGVMAAEAAATGLPLILHALVPNQHAFVAYMVERDAAVSWTHALGQFQTDAGEAKRTANSELLSEASLDRLATNCLRLGFGKGAPRLARAIVSRLDPDLLS